MHLNPAQPARSPGTLLQPVHAHASASRDDFASSLGRARAQELPKEERAQLAAAQLVSAALVQPVFKQMRESTQATGPFAPGRGEKMFRQLLDTATADRLVTSGRWGLVDAVARRMLGNETPPNNGPTNGAAA
ncbi:MAG: rod-binding protein [Phycisphaeraceae bacterium]|nr:rod-binding protein [Phycisphaeraceae bacterium]MBX3408694.1 rod-binding protein [Phycisphaeraceae bacterium]